MKPRSFGAHFTRYLARTLLLSIVCTALLWTVSWLLVFEYGFLNPANHYERQIPLIVDFVDRHGDRVLSPEFQGELDRIIPSEGFHYQIANPAGAVVYGTLAKEIVSGPDDLIKNLNTTHAGDGSFVTYHPIVGETGGLAGLLVLEYDVSLIASNRSRTTFAQAFLIGNMIVPFFFIVLFAVLLARRLGRRFEPPIQQLVAAAERIRRQDLDFDMEKVGGTTELMQLSAAINDMRAALKQSLNARWHMEQQRRDMIASLRHELQTPLTIIQGHVDNLVSNPAKRSERLDGYLQTIKANVARATRLVNDLSELEQPGDGDEWRFEIVPRLTDVRAFFREKAEEYRPLCDAAGVQLVHSVHVTDRRDHGTPPPTARDGGGHIFVDPHRLAQILANLMENSLRVTPRGGRIEWTVKVNPDFLRLRVCDTGPGFSQKDIDRVFERFFQGDTLRYHRPGRMGLGLYIVRKLVEKHGGAAHAANRESGGACVTVKLKSMPQAPNADGE